jgi:hypothetical protein
VGRCDAQALGTGERLEELTRPICAPGPIGGREGRCPRTRWGARVTVWQMSTLRIGDDDIAAARAANVEQADYYRGELSRQGRLLADRRAAHEAALAEYQLRGELYQVRRIQREIRLGEYDQHTLQRLLDAIEQRFPRGASATDPHTDDGGHRAQGRGLAER